MTIPPLPPPLDDRRMLALVSILTLLLAVAIVAAAYLASPVTGEPSFHPSTYPAPSGLLIWSPS